MPEHVNNNGSRVSDVRSSLQKRLAGKGAGWGDNEIGDQFANGDDGVVRWGGVDGSVVATTAMLGSWWEGRQGAADTVERYVEA